MTEKLSKAQTFALELLNRQPNGEATKYDLHGVIHPGTLSALERRRLISCHAAHWKIMDAGVRVLKEDKSVFPTKKA